MLWIGLTGGVGTGKSTVADFLREMDVPVIDADQLAKKMSQSGTEGFQRIVSEFGSSVVGVDGELNRKKLGEIVFKNRIHRKKLESILHPMIQDEVKRQKKTLESMGCELAVYDVPLLFEKKKSNEFDAVVVVYTPEILQLERLVQGRKLSLEEAKSICRTQDSIEDKKRLADIVIDNTGTLEELRQKTSEMVEGLLKGKHRHK